MTKITLLTQVVSVWKLEVMLRLKVDDCYRRLRRILKDRFLLNIVNNVLIICIWDGFDFNVSFVFAFWCCKYAV